MHEQILTAYRPCQWQQIWSDMPGLAACTRSGMAAETITMWHGESIM